MRIDAFSGIKCIKPDSQIICCESGFTQYDLAHAVSDCPTHRRRDIFMSGQVSWLAGQHTTVAFPAPWDQWLRDRMLIAYSCGGSSGMETGSCEKDNNPFLA